MEIKDTYASTELAPLLGYKHSRNVLDRASREAWTSRPRAGRGGGKEWLLASMPEVTRLAIRQAVEQQALALVASTAPSPGPAVAPAFSPSPVLCEAILDDRRREKALAKADLVRKYLEWQRKFGATVHQKECFVVAYLGGAWEGLKRELGEKLSWKSIERWKLEQDRAGSVLALADKRGLAHRGRTSLTEDHRKVILGHVLHPNAPKVSYCVRQIQECCKARSLFVPSEATLRRFVSAYTSECFGEFTFWREGKKAWNDKCAISIMRDWTQVNVGDVVIADGHVLNFETLNPDTGKPCRMVMILFYDGRSAHPLGWEVMPSENVACISSAFRRACIALGKFPKVVYIDNGKAFRAKYFKGCADFEQAGFLGLYRDLDCEVVHSWPYHGQSKPIERFWETMHEMEAWTPSYVGNDIAHKPARLHRNENLHRKLHEGLGGRPLTLLETNELIARWFVAYVNRPHKGFHMKGQTPAEVFHAGRGAGLDAADVARMDLMMLQKIVRVITKDGIKVNGRLYWHEKLANRRHEVLVRHDAHYSQHMVKVYTLQGDFICDAPDREHYGIACGMHPVARVLGSAEQQQALQNSIALKRRQEKDASHMMQAMYEHIVLPETQARLAHMESAKQAQTLQQQPAIAARPVRLSEKEVKAIEAAQARGRAALAAAPSYTPSALQRFRDEAERYGYLFAVRHEQGLELVADDIAWMEYFENTAEYQRNYQKRYSDLRELYAFRAARAANA